MGTATSNRAGDGKAKSLDGMGSIVARNFGTFLRKIVKDVDLATVREATSGAVGSPRTCTYEVPLTDLLIFTDASSTADDVGERLTTATDPGLDLGSTNGDIEAPMVVTWAANSVVPVLAHVPLVNLDNGGDITITVRGKMSNTNNKPSFYTQVQFNEADTIITDTSDTFTALYADHTITVAAADLHANAKSLLVRLYPGAHADDVANVTFVSVAYRQLATQDVEGGVLGPVSTPVFNTIDGDTDGARRLRWAAGNSDPIVFGVNLDDIDVQENLQIVLYGAMSGATNAATCDSDAYFNRGDTKVEDASEAFGAADAEMKITIASDDIPSGAKVLNVELTPGSHSTDAMDILAIQVKYTRKWPVDD